MPRPTAPTRRKLAIAEIAAVLLAIDAVVALLLGAPAWVPIALGVLAVDAVAYAAWQFSGLRAQAVPAVRPARTMTAA